MRRRFPLAIGFVILAVAGAHAQAPGEPQATKRYGVEVNLEDFPQGTPKQTLGSVLKAIEDGRIRYLLAQLADPQWVDQRVKEIHGGRFDGLIEETTGKLSSDRTTVRELRRFLTNGTWEEAGDTASARLPDLKNRQVYLRKIGGRWFLENQQKPTAAAKEK
jgi:hypothetical protein